MESFRYLRGSKCWTLDEDVDEAQLFDATVKGMRHFGLEEIHWGVEGGAEGGGGGLDGWLACVVVVFRGGILFGWCQKGSPKKTLI